MERHFTMEPSKCKILGGPAKETWILSFRAFPLRWFLSLFIKISVQYLVKWKVASLLLSGLNSCCPQNCEVNYLTLFVVVRVNYVIVVVVVIKCGNF